MPNNGSEQCSKYFEQNSSLQEHKRKAKQSETKEVLQLLKSFKLDKKAYLVVRLSQIIYPHGLRPLGQIILW